VGTGLHGMDLGEWEFGESGVVVGTFRVKSIKETNDGGEAVLLPRSGDFVGAVSWAVSADTLAKLRIGMHVRIVAAEALFAEEATAR
jgi:hypothetical protein